MHSVANPLDLRTRADGNVARLSRMVILFIRRDGFLGHHEVFHHEQIQIGRAASNDLILDHFLIDGHHATLIADDGWFAVESQRTVPRHERRRGHAPLLAIEGKVLRLQPFVLELEHYTDATEVALLCQVETGDDEMRRVYADWLEEHAQLARAQLLRAQLALLEQPACSPDFDALTERIYALAARVPAGWRSCVARPAIAIGDATLEFGLGVAHNARRITGEPYATLQLTVAGERLAATELFVPSLVTELLRALDQLARLPELPTPLLASGAPADVTVLAHRDADQAVITVRRDGRSTLTRLPMLELRERIARLIEIVAG